MAIPSVSPAVRAVAVSLATVPAELEAVVAIPVSGNRPCKAFSFYAVAVAWPEIASIIR